MSAARAILQVYTGPAAFQKIVLDPGRRCTVGRSTRSDVVLSRDEELGGRHFEIHWDGSAAKVRDLDTPTGIEVAGRPAWSGELRQGGWMKAGTTIFRFFEELTTPAPPALGAEAVLRELAPRRQRGELYAVLDAARSDHVLALLERAVDDHASLYEGAKGRALDDVAPYLVRFVPESDLLERLLGTGWGDAWGIYLASTVKPKLVRRQLRRFLIVEAEPERKRLYFRYYDPRVLRRFAPLATPKQRSELLADLEAIWFEGEAGQLCRLSPEGNAAP